MTELRLRRSELSTPGSSEKMLTRAASSDADLVFCDLEDSVATTQKEDARKHVINALTQLDWGRKTKAVRINGVHTQWWRDDVTEIVSNATVDVLIIPKVHTADDVQTIDTLLTQLESDTARPVALEVVI